MNIDYYSSFFLRKRKQCKHFAEPTLQERQKPSTTNGGEFLKKKCIFAIDL